jgi:dinuclear metal center YbgI/SA1388 family protein
MKVSEVLKILNSGIVNSVKWKNDPSGLLIGDGNLTVKGILTALNPTLEVAKEAKEKGCNLIVSHHPLFKNPTGSLVEGDYYSDIIRYMIKNDISLISFHTNYDLAVYGVSYKLAQALGLENIRPLVPVSEIDGVEINELYKLIVYCPEGYEDRIKKAVDGAGGATIGKYDHCYFSLPGKGNFRPGKETDPFIGKKGRIETVSEIRIETVVPEWIKDRAVAAIRSVHPYEEPVIDLYPLDNNSGNFGLGCIGEMKKGTTLDQFSKKVCKNLSTSSLRIAVKDREQQIFKAAVCGGSGSSVWNYAVKAGADVFLSSEFTHHIYQEASYYINIIDATHHATEQFAKKGLKEILDGAVGSIKTAESCMDTDVVKAVTQI